MVNLVYTDIACLDLDRAQAEILPQLPDAEQDRYASLRRPQRQRQFLASRLLAREGQDRNMIAHVPLSPGLEGLNISHSGPWVACALAERGQLGCDIERTLPRAFDALAEITCSRSEQMHLAHAREGDSTTLFYRYWTAKEAFSKACRRGLALDLRTLEISLDSRELFYPSSIGPESKVSATTALLQPGLAAAVVLFHPAGTTAQWRWWWRDARGTWLEHPPISPLELLGRPLGTGLTAED